MLVSGFQKSILGETPGTNYFPALNTPQISVELPNGILSGAEFSHNLFNVDLPSLGDNRLSLSTLDTFKSWTHPIFNQIAAPVSESGQKLMLQETAQLAHPADNDYFTSDFGDTLALAGAFVGVAGMAAVTAHLARDLIRQPANFRYLAPAAVLKNYSRYAWVQNFLHRGVFMNVFSSCILGLALYDQRSALSIAALALIQGANVSAHVFRYLKFVEEVDPFKSKSLYGFAYLCDDFYEVCEQFKDGKWTEEKPEVLLQKFSVMREKFQAVPDYIAKSQEKFGPVIREDQIVLLKARVKDLEAISKWQQVPEDFRALAAEIAQKLKTPIKEMQTLLDASKARGRALLLIMKTNMYTKAAEEFRAKAEHLLAEVESDYKNGEVDAENVISLRSMNRKLMRFLHGVDVDLKTGPEDEVLMDHLLATVEGAKLAPEISASIIATREKIDVVLKKIKR